MASHGIYNLLIILTYKIFRIDGVLTNIKVENLNKFKVNVIDFRLGPNRLNFAFTLPKVRVTGNYNVSTVLMDGLMISGNGPFELILHST